MPVVLSRSAKLFQERRLPDDRLTRRRPGPRMNVDANLVRHLPLSPPLPLVEILRNESDGSPDQGLTVPWPRGLSERI